MLRIDALSEDPIRCHAHALAEILLVDKEESIRIYFSYYLMNFFKAYRVFRRDCNTVGYDLEHQNENNIKFDKISGNAFSSQRVLFFTLNQSYLKNRLTTYIYFINGGSVAGDL